MSKQYVYNGTEVILTGKRAGRKLRRKVEEIHEITPADQENGTWTKWIHMTDLFEIVDASDP